MTAHAPHHRSLGLTDSARRATLPEALQSLCKAVTEREGFLAGAGHVLRGAGPAPVFDAEGRALKTRTLPADPVLDHLGLRLEAVEGPTPAGPKAAIASLMLRIGLMLRMLDLAHRHLESRVSFGQKTLKHQLVKDAFARAYAVGLTLQDRSVLRMETGEYSGLFDDHCELNRAEMQAEKLMGGHGYLLNGTHSIGYVSMLVASLHGGGHDGR